MGKPLTKEEVNNRIKETFIQNVELISDYKNRRTPVLLHCLECDYQWEANPQNFLYNNKGSKHHCPNCYKTKKIIVQCAWCKKEISRAPSKIQKNKSGFFYCCREHGNLHKNFLKQNQGEWDNSNNYRLKAFNNYEHKCFICNWKEDERILEVHHIDENRNNDQLDNLIILCPTCHRKITLGYYLLDKETKSLIKK